ncbi:MAG: hypothetical protein JXQ30_03720 [Spirochaetes bacterium]|nr:hypothetical protein [Spirochaetota bacterium]
MGKFLTGEETYWEFFAIASDEYGKTFLLAAKGDREEAALCRFFRECNLDLPSCWKMRRDTPEEKSI